MGFLPLLLLFLSVLKPTTEQQDFECTQGRSTCRALAGYKSINATTISDVRKFFNVKHLGSLLGANNLPPNTPANYTIPAQHVVKIPIPCICYNNTGISYKMPIYEVRPDDGLYYIATTMFGGLVKYERIGEVNKLPDMDKIDIGEKLWIPLPCSCDEVAGEEVVHYAHVVEEGSTMESIAQQFSTNAPTLFKLNGIANDSGLIEGNTIDVPLQG